MGAPIRNFKEEEYTHEFLLKTYGDRFHENQWDIFRERNLNFASIIYNEFCPKQVVDFGCSVGTYLEEFLQRGCEVMGFEYSYESCLPYIERVPNLAQYVKFGDVTTEIKLQKKYELAMSIEVAEHIPESKSDVLVNNLCESAEKYIVFTAALPDQGGTGHINCQEQQFWIEKFQSRGWEYDSKTIENMKKIMIPNSKNDGNNCFPNVWSFVYDNLMVFKKK